MPDNHVCPKATPSKADVSDALAVCWTRARRAIGKGAFADRIGVDPKTVNRAITGDSVPELHTALASLLIDPDALTEVFALYGLQPPRPMIGADTANDLATVSRLSRVLHSLADAISDGTRDHIETLEVADLVRAAMPDLANILDEASRIRGLSN